MTGEQQAHALVARQVAGQFEDFLAAGGVHAVSRLIEDQQARIVYEGRGQLEVRGWDEAYLRGGHFDQDAMLQLIEEVLRGGKAQGFPITRLVANMEWALEDRPGVEDIVEYETRLNYVLPKYDDAVC